MKPLRKMLLMALSCTLMACLEENPSLPSATPEGHEGHGAATPEVEKGVHRGRLLHDGNFTLELAIFETGVPPEFRAWFYQDGKPLAADTVDLTVKLTRLGSVDTVSFKPQGDFLRSTSVVYEPHSFIVHITATQDGKTHTWQYESFEGRTAIEQEVAEAMEIATETAGPAVLKETLKVYGKVVPNQEQQRKVQARFEGLITGVKASVGDKVTQGQPLVTIESNESLKSYTINAPISGVVVERNAHPGEQTQGRALLRIADTSSVWAELAVFPGDITRIKPGAKVMIRGAAEESATTTTIRRLALSANANQSVNARVVLDNSQGHFLPGAFVTGDITVAEYKVPLAVKRAGLQAFRDFTVVYAQVGNEYEVRMLELGREAGEWVEVLDGLKPGTRYVTENSYIIKADIEKSGAAHDH